MSFMWSLEMNEIRELSVDELELVGGGWRKVLEYIATEALPYIAGAVADYNNSGAAAEFQMGSGSGAGTFG